MNIIEKLICLQFKFYRVSHLLLAIMGVEVPKSVVFKAKNNDKLFDLGGVRFVHRSCGAVLHPKTTIGKNVHIYQNVTIGKACPWEPSKEGEGCIIEDNVILSVGSVILFKDKLVVGKGTIIGANAVLTQSTGENEIWVGIPARKIGYRKDQI